MTSERTFGIAYRMYSCRTTLEHSTDPACITHGKTYPASNLDLSVCCRQIKKEYDEEFERQRQKAGGLSLSLRMKHTPGESLFSKRQHGKMYVCDDLRTRHSIYKAKAITVTLDMDLSETTKSPDIEKLVSTLAFPSEGDNLYFLAMNVEQRLEDLAPIHPPPRTDRRLPNLEDLNIAFLFPDWCTELLNGVSRARETQLMRVLLQCSPWICPRRSIKIISGGRTYEVKTFSGNDGNVIVEEFLDDACFSTRGIRTPPPARREQYSSLYMMLFSSESGYPPPSGI